ncbi:MAG: aminoacetone oxidase family FAD-binding enzyme [Bacteroidales bacterium]
MQIEIAIIGGGAAGLYAAAIAADQYKERGETPSIVVLEKMDRCGRKIALTGKGRCNLTNTKPWEEFALHIHPKNIFLKNAFYAMSNTKTMEFFEKIGLPLVTERGDRVFPQSMRAADVTQALLAYLKKRGVKIITGFEVKEISRNEDAGKIAPNPKGKEVSSGFKITAAYRSEEILAKKIILATGGLSYPTTGSTGDGYVFAKCFGHKIAPCFPSLTALIPKNYRDDMYDISLKNVEAQLIVDKDIVAKEFGDLDFTNGGIEGPIGFKLSRKGVQSIINGQKVSLLLDLKPAISKTQLTDRIGRELEEYKENRYTRDSDRVNFILPKLLPKNLIDPFLSLNTDLTIKNLPDKLKTWKFEIYSYVGYERCVITAGGISLADVSQKTMESKLTPGLYFAGEILDLDGDTGGYNLQIAFSTAALAALSAVRNGV